MDSKGRLAIPKRYREELVSTCDGQLVCTIDHQLACLLLYPLDEWERVESRLAKLSNLNPAQRRLQRMLLGHATECSIDSQGRILIAPVLRQYAGLDSKAMLIGQLNKFEIWQASRWQQQIDADIAAQADSDVSGGLGDFSL